jgi:hypothetical protein
MRDQKHQFELPEGFTAVTAHSAQLQPDEAYIAVEDDGVVGGCFTESEITEHWFNDAVGHGALVLRGPRLMANRLFGERLAEAGVVDVLVGYKGERT